MIVGVDESGYGCSAGPMVVCAFAAGSASWSLEGLGDSKTLSEKKRERLYEELNTKYSGNFVSVWSSVEDINKFGLGKCHRIAMAKAASLLIEKLGEPDRLIFDGGTSYLEGGVGIPKADSLFPAVSAASVIAKVSRDRFVLKVLHPKYPDYGFDKHKGYWSEEHKRAVVKHGVSVEHRTGYKNIQELLEQETVAKAGRRK